MPRPSAGSNALPLPGLVLLVPPAYFVARWIHVFSELSVHEDRVAAFGSVLPRVLQDPLANTLFEAACGATAGALGAAGLIRLVGLRRLLCAATLGSAGWCACGRGLRSRSLDALDLHWVRLFSVESYLVD